MSGIVGPIFSDLDALSFVGKKTTIATAFYSQSAMFKIKTSADRLDLLMRLDLSSCEEWKRGMIDPAGLLAFTQHHRDEGRKVNLLVHPFAHAKAYIGQDGFFVGSANLTLKGFSGVGHELLWHQSDKAACAEFLKVLDHYAKGFEAIQPIQLENYVDRNRATVIAWRKANPLKFRKQDEDRVESSSPKAARHGDYEKFKIWLAKRPEKEASTIFRRANGEGGLSGHIRANFYGLRQWLLFDADMMKLAISKSADTYNLARDSIEENKLKSFVDNHAANEPDFSLSTWRGYLPSECGGRARNRGGTIGNLHRMIPLIAKFLK